VIYKLPILNGKEVIRRLEQIGFRRIRQTGSHVRLKHSDGRIVTVPIHAGEDVGWGLLRKILRDAKISPREFEEL